MFEQLPNELVISIISRLNSYTCNILALSSKLFYAYFLLNDYRRIRFLEIANSFQEVHQCIVKLNLQLPIKNQKILMSYMDKDIGEKQLARLLMEVVNVLIPACQSRRLDCKWLLNIELHTKDFIGEERSIGWYYQPIDFDSLVTISDAILGNKIKKLSMNWCANLASDNFQLLTKSMSTSKILSEVDLSYNILISNCIVILAEALILNHSIIKLILVNSNIGDIDLNVIVNALVTNCSLLDLDLSFNNITEKGVKYSGHTLSKNHFLVHLNLEHNKFKSSDVKNDMDMINKTLCRNQDERNIRRMTGSQ